MTPCPRQPRNLFFSAKVVSRETCQRAACGQHRVTRGLGRARRRALRLQRAKAPRGHALILACCGSLNCRRWDEISFLRVFEHRQALRNQMNFSRRRRRTFRLMTLQSTTLRRRIVPAQWRFIAKSGCVRSSTCDPPYRKTDDAKAVTILNQT